MSEIVLVDAYSQIFRCYYGMKSNLTNGRGEPVGALYGMVRLLMQMDKTLPCEFGAFCFDKGKATRRCGLLPEYKANRAPMPEDLRAQVEPMKEFMNAFGWPVLMQDGQEADDLIAAVTAVRDGNAVTIITHDKDIHQLLADEAVRILTPGKGNAWLEARAPQVIEKFGVTANLLGDYLALVGDSSDNIKGVDGIGPKTAVKLLNEYGGLEPLLAGASAMKAGRLKDNLLASGELLSRNRQLVALDTQLPEGWKGLSDIVRRAPDWKKLCELSRDQGFMSLLPKFEEACKAEEQRIAAAAGPSQLLLF